MSRRGSAAAATLANSAAVFAALGDSTRLRLVARLSAAGPLSIARLSEGTDITRQAITKHLQALAAAGVVTDEWQGRERIWQLEPRRLQMARRALDQISAEWDEVIGRLKAFVERDA